DTAPIRAAGPEARPLNVALEGGPRVRLAKKAASRFCLYKYRLGRQTTTRQKATPKMMPPLALYRQACSRTAGRDLGGAARMHGGGHVPAASNVWWKAPF